MLVMLAMISVMHIYYDGSGDINGGVFNVTYFIECCTYDDRYILLF